MEREEIERLVEQAAAEARGNSRHISLDHDKARSVLNTLFLLLAFVGLVVYFAVSHIPGLIIIGIGMLLKVIEIFIRFLL